MSLIAIVCVFALNLGCSAVIANGLHVGFFDCVAVIAMWGSCAAAVGSVKHDRKYHR